MANNSSQKIITCHHIQKDLNLKLILAKEKKEGKKEAGGNIHRKNTQRLVTQRLKCLRLYCI
jgi:hypothetical protein